MRSLSASGVLAILLGAPAANAAQFTYDVFGELQREDFGGSIVGAMTFLEGAATPFDVDLTYIGDFVFRDISYEGPIRFTEIDEERTSRSFSGFVVRREGDGDLVDETGRALFFFNLLGVPPEPSLLPDTNSFGFTAGTGPGTCLDADCSMSINSFLTAETFSVTLQTAAVPLPASAWMLLAALGAGALIRRKA